MERKQIEPYLATYFHSSGAKHKIPVAGNFELTPRCNFNCPMCYIHSKNGHCADRELSAEQWLSIAESARDRGLLFVLLTGGEPLLRRDFFEIYGEMKKMGLMVSVNSNGSLIRGEILERFIEDPPYRFNISLYGACNETYEKMCGTPMFDTVVENLKALKNAGIDVRLNLSVTPYNMGDIQGVYDTAGALGLHVKASSYMYPPLRIAGKTEAGRLDADTAAECSVFCDSIRFSEEEFKMRAESMMSGCAQVHDDECLVVQGEEMHCRAGRSSFWLTWDGTMLPCGMMNAPAAYPLETGFDEAWRIIREETEKIRLPAQCAVCSKKGICNVCAAVCLAETGGYDRAPEYVCRFTDGVLKETAKEYKRRFGG